MRDNPKRALIIGITGQDGSFLAEYLLHRGYEVHGLIRRASTFNTGRIAHLLRDVHERDNPLVLHYGDLSDMSSIQGILTTVVPHEVYNLAAQSHVRVSFDIPEYTGDITGLGVTRLLEALLNVGHKDTRLYQASSSEMFGSTMPPQDEFSPFAPRSPYGCAKVYAYHMVKNYRDGYHMYASNGILFNHESTRRGATFVTRKIAKAVAAICAGKQDVVYLGNLDAKRDWGYAPDYVEAMWCMLQQDKPGDYVIGTGEMHTVSEFVEEAFGYVGLDWRAHVRIDANYLRPTEVDALQAFPAKARSVLGWKPRITFKDLVRIMVDAELERADLNDGYFFTKREGELAVRRYELLYDWHKWEDQIIRMEGI